METFTTLFRSLARNKVLSSINLLGLALGISSCLLIVLYVTDELSYDSHNVNLERIYRVNSKFTSAASIDHVAISSAPLPGELKKFPEVEKAVRLISHDAETTVKQGNVIYQEKNLVEGDPDVFEVFSCKFINGNPKTALVQPKSVVLTQSMSKKYFGDEDPIGKILKIGKDDHQVTALIEDLPLNSDLRFTLISSLDTTDNLNDWFEFSYFNYILFNEKSLSSPDFLTSFQKKLDKIVDEKVNAVIRKEDQTLTASFDIQPLKGLHFKSGLQYDTPKGNMNYVIIFSAVALLLLIIACLNYVNFSMVQSIERSKEVAIRKIAGAGFYQLVVRYIGQSLMMTFLSVIVAVGIVIVLIPFFNEVASKNFSITDLFDFQIIGAVVSIVIFVGVLAGSYPAFYTSSIKAVNALKGKITTPKGQAIRKTSITIQFMISSGLLICTAIAYNQMTYIRNYDLGFRRNNVLVISMPEDSMNFHKQKSFSDGVSALAGIEQVSLTASRPGDVTARGSISIKTDGKDAVRMVNYSYIDENYLAALQIPLKEGRNFEKGSINDYNNSVMVNESLARMMGWKNPLEEKIHFRGKYCDIIGVVKDYHYHSLHNKVDPMLFVLHDHKVNNVLVVLQEGPLNDHIATIRDEWSKTFSDEPFVYQFLDESVAAEYARDETAMTVFSYFSVLTIIISCLGLFGLSSLSVYQRKREIGIRKAIGASFKSLIVLFSREYMILILISIAIIAPASWYLTDFWLKDFLYKPDMTFHLYGIAGIAIILVSLVTIVLSITRISNSKPSDLIRD